MCKQLGGKISTVGVQIMFLLHDWYGAILWILMVRNAQKEATDEESGKWALSKRGFVSLF